MDKKFKDLILSIFLFLFFSLTAIGQEDGVFLVRGDFTEQLFAIINPSDISIENTKIGLTNSLHLKIINTDREYVKFEGDFTLGLSSLYAKDLALLKLNIQAPALASYFKDSASIPFIEVKKLYSQIDFDFFLISMGRMVINAGVGKIFSPLDFFSSASQFTLTRERSGIDCIKVLLPFGDVHGFEGAFISKNNFNSSDLYGRIYTNFLGFDYSAALLYKPAEKIMITGLSAKGEIFTLVYGEGIVNYNLDQAEYTLEALAGIEKTFLDSYSLSLEYYYNENNALTQNHVFLGTHYLSLLASAKLFETSQLSGVFIYNFSNLSNTSTLAYTNELLPNVYVNLSGAYSFGMIQKLETETEITKALLISASVNIKL